MTQLLTRARKDAGAGTSATRLFRKRAAEHQPEPVPPIVYETLGAPGRALDPAVRDEMEARFDYDFRDVRVHTDAQAAESARAVNAVAYTVGRDIAFAPGRYHPANPSGRALLAHELTHVIQQPRSPIQQGELKLDSPSSAAETQAQAAALALVPDTGPPRSPAPTRMHQTAPLVQRQTATLSELRVSPGDIVESEEVTQQREEEAEERKLKFPGKEQREEAPAAAQFFAGVLMGDFIEDQTSWETIGQIVLGFVPILGQVGDVRDLIAILIRITNERGRKVESWVNLVLVAIGFIPGFGDLIKAGARSGMRWLRRGRVLDRIFAVGESLATRASATVRRPTQRALRWLKAFIASTLARVSRRFKSVGRRLRQKMQRWWRERVGKDNAAGPSQELDANEIEADAALDEVSHPPTGMEPDAGFDKGISGATSAREHPERSKGDGAENPLAEGVAGRAQAQHFGNGPSTSIKSQQKIEGFVFTTYERRTSQHWARETMREARGRLRLVDKPDTVVKRAHERIRTIFRRSLPKRTLDHAGHKVARELGGPAVLENLDRQNNIANAWGTWRELERTWKRRLKQGIDVEIRVVDIFKDGAERPYKRLVEWLETSTDGTVQHFNRSDELGNVIYGNFPSHVRK